MPKIHKIVLTGGPGGGKSTSLAYINKILSDNGIKVFTIPEAATLLFNSGVSLRNISDKQMETLQVSMLYFIMAIEDSIVEIAKTFKNDSVILCDRGVMDGGAFVSSPLWGQITNKVNKTNEELRSRYDGVILLHSAANGSVENYTTENNKARAETPEQAALVDKRLESVWLGHPHLRVIPSSSDFTTKLHNVLSAVYRIVGIPEPIEIERKWVLTNHSEWEVPVPYHDSVIEQTYLKDNSRVRLRNFKNLSQYTHTIKKELQNNSREEIERIISPSEYSDLLMEADPNRKKIHKIRRCFLYENQYFEMDFYITPKSGLITLELELNSEDSIYDLPPWLCLTDVTGNPAFLNSNIAKG